MSPTNCPHKAKLAVFPASTSKERVVLQRRVTNSLPETDNIVSTNRPLKDDKSGWCQTTNLNRNAPKECSNGA